MFDLTYRSLVYVHLLLFVLWLGADVGVFVLGQHFRKRYAYSLDQRIALLKLLVAVDMGPRTAWALMVPLSLSVATMGGLLALPDGVVWLAWAVGGAWLWLIWDSHTHDQTPRAARNRRIETPVKLAIMAFYLWLGLWSLAFGRPIELPWLAWKATLFGAIFFVAMMIDVQFKPVGGQLTRLLKEGSSDATETPLRTTMDRTRIWVMAIYVLLMTTAWLGVAQPMPS